MFTVALAGKILPARELANSAATSAPPLKWFPLRVAVAPGSRYTLLLKVTPLADRVPLLLLSLIVKAPPCTCTPDWIVSVAPDRTETVPVKL